MSMITTMAPDQKFQCSDVKVSEHRINICHMSKLLKFNVITEMIFTSLLSVISTNLLCPYKPEVITIRNLVLGLPSVPLLLPNGHFCITLKELARTKGSKKFELFATFDIRLTLKKSSLIPGEIPKLPDGFNLNMPNLPDGMNLKLPERMKSKEPRKQNKENKSTTA